ETPDRCSAGGWRSSNSAEPPHLWTSFRVSWNSENLLSRGSPATSCGVRVRAHWRRKCWRRPGKHWTGWRNGL
ncbi:hypothetical protein FS837_002436, partial [Tulasnella sp. UAMH 9824]